MWEIKLEPRSECRIRPGFISLFCIAATSVLLDSLVLLLGLMRMESTFLEKDDANLMLHYKASFWQDKTLNIKL